jgi:HSP20 family protein
MVRKKSFFERLTGAINVDYDEPYEEEETAIAIHETTEEEGPQNDWLSEESGEGQLGVDVYHTSDEIIIKTMVAGVRPEDLDISITRDMVVIKGKREETHGIPDENYFHKELYWGSFSRTVLLPLEVESENAEAVERHGLLIIRLPKIDKEKQTRLKVKSV